MDKQLIEQIERVAKGVEANASTDERALAADTLHSLNIDEYVPKHWEHDVDKRFENMLDECYPDYEVGNWTFSASEVFKKCTSEMEYNMARNDYVSDNFTESPTIPDVYYDNDELDSLADQADEIYTSVQDHVLDQLDENSQEHADVSNAGDFQELIRIGNSFNEQAVLQSELEAFKPASAAATEGAGNGERVERRRSQRL